MLCRRLSSVCQGCLRAGLSVSLDVCRQCLTGVRGQGCPSPSPSVVGVSRVSESRAVRLPRRLSSVSQGCLRAGLSPVEYFTEEEVLGGLFWRKVPWREAGLG